MPTRNLKILFIWILVSLTSGNVFSQEQYFIDSLQTQLKELNAAKLQTGSNAYTIKDSLIAKVLLQLTMAYAHNNPDKAMEYANQALQLSKQSGYKKGIGNAYTMIGSINWDKGEYVQAMEFYKTALQIFREIGSKKGIAICYNNFGLVYWRQGNFPEALKYYLSSLKIIEEIGDIPFIANSHNNIGNIYLEQGSYPEALKNYSVSLAIGEELGDKEIIESAYNNIGVVYQKQGNYPEALKNLLLSLKYSKETGDNKRVANSYIFIADFYLITGNYTEVLNNAFAALKIHEETGDKPGIAYSYLALGNGYTKQGKYNDASQYLNKALSLSKELGNMGLMKDCYNSLSALDSSRENYKQAYEHYKMYITMRDSVYNETKTKKAVQSQMQYDFDKKEDSLKQKQFITETKLQIEKKQKYIYWIGLAMLALLSFFILLSFRNQKKINRLAAETHAKEKAELELQTLRAQLNPHFIFNCISSIDGLIQNNEKYNATNYLNKFAKLMRNVLEDSKQDSVTFSNDIETLKLYLDLEQLRNEDKYSTELIVPEELLNSNYIVPPLVIQPFVENAIKHGLKNKPGKKGLLKIEVKQVEDHLQYSISDNGIGRQATGGPDTDGHRSYGLQMSAGRIKLFNNEQKPSVTVEDRIENGVPAGTTVTVKLKFR